MNEPRPGRRRHDTRRGTTLLHVLIYTFCLSILFATMAIFLRGAERATHTVTEAYLRSNDFERLARDMRSDAHWATSVAIEGESLVFQVRSASGDQKIGYSITERGLARVARGGDHPLAQEEYMLGESMAMMAHVDAGSRLCMVRFSRGPRKREMPLDVGRYVRQELIP